MRICCCFHARRLPLPPSHQLLLLPLLLLLLLLPLPLPLLPLPLPLPPHRAHILLSIALTFMEAYHGSLLVCVCCPHKGARPCIQTCPPGCN